MDIEIISDAEVQQDWRQAFLDALETLVPAVEAVSDLPEMVYGETCGVRIGTTRQEYICEGYTHRYSREVSDLKLVRMVGSVLFNLSFSAHILKLREPLDRAYIQQLSALVFAYYEANPVPQDR